jgi:GTP-binding protein
MTSIPASVVQKLTERKGDLTDMRPSGVGRTRHPLLRADPLADRLPARTAVRYPRHRHLQPPVPRLRQPFKGELPGRRTGVLISNGTGQSVAYALWNLEERGPIMIDAGVDIYEGMIIGEHSRENDLEVNPLKGKQLTNIRTTSKDEAVRLTPPKKLTLEQSPRLYRRRRICRSDPQERSACARSGSTRTIASA